MKQRRGVDVMSAENTQNIISDHNRFADFNNAQKKYKWVFPTPNSLRHYVFHSKTNGLDQAISRLGKKLVFNLSKLEEWIANGGAK